MPTVVHQTIDEAKQEAERLARKHPGGVFIVFKSIATVHVEIEQPPVKWVTE